VFVISWLRARFSPDFVTFSGICLSSWRTFNGHLLARAEVFFVVATIAGVGWTLSATNWGGGTARNAKAGREGA